MPSPPDWGRGLYIHRLFHFDDSSRVIKFFKPIYFHGLLQSLLHTLFVERVLLLLE